MSLENKGSDEYLVKKVGGEHFLVDNYLNKNGYEPVTKGQLVFVPDMGFELTMWTEEENPRGIYHNPNDPVYTDSCLEGFVDFFPELNRGYINIEMNPNGASLVAFGPNRGERKSFVELGIPHPEVKAEVINQNSKKCWKVTTTVYLSVIEEIYGTSKFGTGHEMKGNFYKCGDHTLLPHWGTVFPVSDDPIDFHVPQYFGKLVIV